MSMISSAILVDLNNERNGLCSGVSGYSEAEIPPSIQLLLRFQRLLISQLMPLEAPPTTKQVIQGEL